MKTIEDIPLRVLRSASLSLLWGIIERANKEYILTILNSVGISNTAILTKARKIEGVIGPDDDQDQLDA